MLFLQFLIFLLQFFIFFFLYFLFLVHDVVSLFVELCHGWPVTLVISSAVLEEHTGCLYVFSPIVAPPLAFQCLCTGICYIIHANRCFLLIIAWILFCISVHIFLQFLFLVLSFNFFCPLHHCKVLIILYFSSGSLGEHVSFLSASLPVVCCFFAVVHFFGELHQTSLEALQFSSP